MMCMRGKFITDSISKSLVIEERRQVHSRNTLYLIVKAGLWKRLWLSMEFHLVTILMYECNVTVSLTLYMVLLVLFRIYLLCIYFCFASHNWLAYYILSSCSWDTKLRMCPPNREDVMYTYSSELHGRRGLNIRKGLQRTLSQIWKIGWRWFLMLLRGNFWTDRNVHCCDVNIVVFKD